MLKTIFLRSKVQKQKAASDNADSLRVIGVGLPRTGTSSLKAALEILGFGPCHHMSELFSKPNQSVEFIRAYDGHTVDFYSLMKGYGSAVVSPAADFYKEIRQCYPQVKLVLTVRDTGEEWFESFNNSIRPSLSDISYYFAVYPIRFLRLQCIVARKIWKKWKIEYGQIGPQIHDQHTERVINENQEGDVLVFNVKEGWPPLCKFLGVDVPQDIPFPKVNDTNAIKQQLALSMRMGWCVWAFWGVAASFAVYISIKLIM